MRARFLTTFVVLCLAIAGCGDGGETEDSGTAAASSPAVVDQSSTTSPTTTQPTTTTQPSTTTSTTSTTAVATTTSSSTSTTSSTTTTVAPTTTPPPLEGPAVVGRLTIQFLPWGEAVEIPIAPPQGLALLPIDQDTGDEVILDIYGSEDEMAITKDEKAAAVLGFQPTWESAALTVDFAAPLSQGEYWLQMVLIDDIRWEPSAYFGLLAATPYFSVAPEGCTYIGDLFYSYYRVAPGDQPALVGQMGDDLGLEELYYSEHEDGTFVGESADFSIPPEDEQPAQAAGCQTRPVFFEPSS